MPILPVYTLLRTNFGYFWSDTYVEFCQYNDEEEETVKTIIAGTGLIGHVGKTGWL